jgi:hypothetical protein
VVRRKVKVERSERLPMAPSYGGSKAVVIVWHLIPQAQSRSE